MRPQGTLWLHVGTHKTGTTSIQRAVGLREAELAAAGIALWPEANAQELANHFIRPSLWTIPRLLGISAPVDVAIFDELAARMDAARGGRHDLLISSQEFCMMRDALEAQVLKGTLGQVFARVVPIMAFRDVDDWRASRTDELVRIGMWERQEALPDALSSDGDWYYDAAAVRRFWAQIGDGVEIDYDMAVAREGSILPALARALGQPGLFDGLDLRLNRRGAGAGQ
ncbi:MAG TPA: hypothetical protein PLL33_06780 [Paracoccus sp. (in: a-proteobacteria)]|nr:hypothetical protein [Paracoccus sp. (in: a-proteobacteria)]